MGEKEDSAWVFDSLVGFLQGPIWSAPLMTFIEEKSLIFEADTEDSLEYREVYQEYKNLVDLLLGCYMEDMEITPEQFEHACSVNKNTKMPVQFQQSLFEQIWAANEYEIFKRMMIQKNLELQLQALNLIEQKFGLTPAALMSETDALQDELVMEELLHTHILDAPVAEASELESDRAFLEEHHRLALQYQNERELLQKALRASANSSRSTSPEPERREVQEDLEAGALQPKAKVPELKKLPPLHPIPVKERKPDEKRVLEKPTPAQSSVAREEAGEGEMKRRQDYLKTQRDKLVALKKQARSQRLETNAGRPSSARVVAEAAMMGKQDLEVQHPLEPSTLQVRKALAARLKAEVVHK